MQGRRSGGRFICTPFSQGRHSVSLAEQECELCEQALRREEAQARAANEAREIERRSAQEAEKEQARLEAHRKRQVGALYVAS